MYNTKPVMLTYAVVGLRGVVFQRNVVLGCVLLFNVANIKWVFAMQDS